MVRSLFPLLLAAVLALLPGCTILEQAPKIPELDQVRKAPQILPAELAEMVDLLEEQGLPDLSDLADLPPLESLPILQSIPGGIVYRGPVQRTLAAGDRLPGTDIVLRRVGEDGAEFEIDNLHSVRRIGDSLDFDGEWPGLKDVPYSVRLRIYQISDQRVRVAGVHQLGVSDIRPRLAERGAARASGAAVEVLRFPFVAHVGTGDKIAGTTFGYDGVGDRGARITGVREDEFPYRRTGDSILWRGELRQGIPAELNVRVIHYDGNALQTGGVVSVSMPIEDGEQNE